MNLIFLASFLLLLTYTKTIGLPQCSTNCSVANCAQCTNSTCNACFNGYSLSLNTCTVNICNVTGCSLCDSKGACLKCTNLYAVYN